jgi:hypothetical protein
MTNSGADGYVLGSKLLSTKRAGRGRDTSRNHTQSEKKQEWTNQGFGDQQALNGFQLTVASSGCLFASWVGPGEERARVKECGKRKETGHFGFSVFRLPPRRGLGF